MHQGGIIIRQYSLHGFFGEICVLLDESCVLSSFTEKVRYLHPATTLLKHTQMLFMYYLRTKIFRAFYSMFERVEKQSETFRSLSIQTSKVYGKKKRPKFFFFNSKMIYIDMQCHICIVSSSKSLYCFLQDFFSNYSICIRLSHS